MTELKLASTKMGKKNQSIKEGKWEQTSRYCMFYS
jgi:hypothetical protein